MSGKYYVRGDSMHSQARAKDGSGPRMCKVFAPVIVVAVVVVAVIAVVVVVVAAVWFAVLRCVLLVRAA